MIAPDLRGFGDSDMPEGVDNYLQPVLVADVIGLLDALGLEKVHLIAHDFGAMLGWNLCNMHPERVHQYTALSVGHPEAYLNRGGAAQNAKGWYTYMFQLEDTSEKILLANDFAMIRKLSGNDEEADHWNKELSRPGRATAALNWYRAMFKWRKTQDFTDVAHRTQVPVMGIWSKKDIALSQQQMVFSSLFMDAPFQYRQIDDAGHWMQVDQPEKLNQLLLSRLADFAGSIPASASLQPAQVSRMG